MPGSSPCGARPHAGRMMRGLAAPIAAPPAKSVRPSGRTGCAPPRNDCAWPLAMSGHHARPARMVTRAPMRARDAACHRTRIRACALIPLLAYGGGSGSHFPGAQRKSKIAPETVQYINNNLQTYIGCITDSAYKNQLVVVSVQYGPFNTYIPIRSTTIGKSRVARDLTAMHTSWRSNSDIKSVTRASMTFRVVRTNQYNQDLGLIHSTNGNHLESPNDGNSIDHQVTIHLHAQSITMFPTNEAWYFASQMLVSSSGGLILILTAQSTRNEFRMHNKMCEIQKRANDRNDLGFNAGESNAGETSTQSYLVYEKFKEMSFVKASVIYDSCESLVTLNNSNDGVSIFSLTKSKRRRVAPTAESIPLQIQQLISATTTAVNSIGLTNTCRLLVNPRARASAANRFLFKRDY
ncbi:ent-copalyl diphosphate synthase 1, chloroplastic [Dorcoceras hygrometricum]|uniref:Ent-copalyl diphosphate synthase 1, chloroplastic n=1 Tax=Dorcoceras hygrometricum TaxID=472368 RepID=A0A2Z7D9V6_9LAMI|nr:ent-copalyl diphosphate synthase 1, chloroplastic [Dorcoceras hygrometricum]